MVDQRTIDEILGNLQLDQKENVQKLRSLIKNAAPETNEIVKNGKITYKLGVKDFVWINHFSDHIDLEFAMGASLSSSLLRSRGISQSNDNIRHVPISGNFDKIETELFRLVSEAAIQGFKHCQPKGVY
jgi:hypothetical protein